MSDLEFMTEMLKRFSTADLLDEWHLVQHSNDDPEYKKALEKEIARRNELTGD